jgi:hypothetical protein
MPSDFKINEASREGMCNFLVDRLDLGATAALLYIRSGAPPATPATADSGTLLATLTFSDPAFGNSSSSGTATASAITAATAVATGIAGHFRAKDSDGNTIFQGTAGEAADTPDMVFNDKDIAIGGNVSCTSMQVSMPAS